MISLSGSRQPQLFAHKALKKAPAILNTADMIVVAKTSKQIVASISKVYLISVFMDILSLFFNG